MSEHPYEIRLGNGDWAEADTPEGALLAARTLCNDAAEGAGQARLQRREVTIVFWGVYDGVLTPLARLGRLTTDAVQPPTETELREAADALETLAGIDEGEYTDTARLLHLANRLRGTTPTAGDFGCGSLNN